MKINTKNIPQKPGVYLFSAKGGSAPPASLREAGRAGGKDQATNILYIGKATNLKSRVSSYFQQSSTLSPAKQIMIGKIKKVEYIITSSATEALLLESSLIRKHQPPYNVDLKDDKYFQYIKISLDEEYPRVFTVRRISKDKTKYFGPFVSGAAVRQTLHLLRKLFPHRNFPKPISDHHLNFLLRRYPQLLGPSNKKEYRQTINRIIKFLNGQYEDIVKNLKEKMMLASEQKQFEKAAGFRDKIQAIKRIMEKQKVVSTKLENQDIISLAFEQDMSAINLFNIRNGKLLNKQSFILRNTADQSAAEIVQAFIEQYYPQATDLPKQIIIPQKGPNKSIIEKTFRLKLLVPQKGPKKHYLQLGQENAKDYLKQQKASWQKDEVKIQQALQQFKQYLFLKKIPQRIEAFDISNIQGQNAVGSMIVFTNGRSDKKWYRKFKIKTIHGANDPAMMAEIVARRFRHTTSKETKSWPKSDLIILDGGKGQLNIALKAIPLKIPTIALAKKQEDIYLPHKKDPINFPKNSEALYLIQRIRDEAHRFAIGYFRKSHQQDVNKSLLDEIQGLGPKTKKQLLKHFGSVEKIKDAPLKKIIGLIGPYRAKLVKQNL